MARWFVAGFGLLVICVGAFVLVQPLGLKGFADVFLTSSGLWFAAGLRVVVGILLWISAATSRTPRVLRVFGVLFVLGGIFILVTGLERMQAIAEWGVGLDASVLRGVGLMAIAMGAFFVWSVWPRRRES